MKYYKLTDHNNRTRGTLWGENVTHKAKGKGNDLCSEDVIHVYDHPLKAAMFNANHANFNNPVLWECRVKRVVANDCLKVGVKECTTIKVILLPEITTNQRVRFGIYCALEVYYDKEFIEWADAWLSGVDRSTDAAWAAAEVAEVAEVAWAAAWVAWAAARAAEAAGAAEAAAWVAWAARAAARAAAIDLVPLIKKAIEEEL